MRLEVLDGDRSWDEIVPLVKLVYPPHVLATIVWRDVTWANADRRLVLYEEEQAVAVTSMYMRECLCDGAPIRIGGIGGVMTHPAYRRRGLATAALSHAERLYRDDVGVAFSLLFCEPRLATFYADRGWHSFRGSVIVEQPGGRGPFTIMSTMVRGLGRPAATEGIIDLCGLPW
ncbi:MAG TPA: GNAT family N-acetyltransferase [Stellaceae bacterium]